MTPLAAVLQACIVGGALIGVLVLLGGTAVADYLAHRAAVAADNQRYETDEPGPCAWHWTTDGSPCGCDPDEDGDEPTVEDDPGAEWDRARDRDTDFWRGVA